VKAVAELTPTSVGDFLPDPVKKRMGRPRKEAKEVADGN